MRFSSLVVCTTLLICLKLPAQHSSSVSSGGHSSSSSSGGFSSHSSPPSSSGIRSSTQPSSSRVAPLRHGPTAELGLSSTGNAQPAKRGVLSFFRRPWKSGPKPPPANVVLRGPICKHRPCFLPCPGGTYANGKGGCVVPLANSCPGETIWSGSNCAVLSNFRLNDCSGLALAMEQQARRAQFVQDQQESSCSDPAALECTGLTARSQSEADRYRRLQQQYELCRQQGFFSFAGGYYPFGGYYQFGNLFNVYLDALQNE